MNAGRPSSSAEPVAPVAKSGIGAICLCGRLAAAAVLIVLVVSMAGCSGERSSRDSAAAVSTTTQLAATATTAISTTIPASPSTTPTPSSTIPTPTSTTLASLSAVPAPPSTTRPPTSTTVAPQLTTEASAAASTPASDETAVVTLKPPAPADGIGWEDLEHLSINVSGDVVRLQEGRATLSYGGESASIFTLQNRVASGDLDGDGDTDVVAHIVERSAGTGVFHMLVPVIDEGGEPLAGRAVFVGDRIVMNGFSVEDGLIEVSLFDRVLDEPFSIISRHVTLVIDVSMSPPQVTVVSSETIDDLPLPDPERPAIDIRFAPGALSATETGSIRFRERQTYTVQAAQGQAFTATLDAPLGVWLDLRLGEEVVLSAARRSQLVETTLPASGAWQATVLSSQAGQADYELTVEVLPPGDTQEPASTTTVPTVRAPRPVTPDDGDNVVYLTFDDGPHPLYTPQVLDVLARYDARATFFVLGSLAEAYPGIIERIVAEGHTVANHTWDHEVLAGLPRPAFDETVSRTQGILAELATPCLRPPYASIDAFTQEWAAEHGLAVMMWTIDPGDWRRPPAEEIAEHIVERARSGSVVLLHDGGGPRENTVLGLEMALEQLADQDLRYEPVCR